MSTSLTSQPAFMTTTTERTKAVPDRTIFGTTLDNYGKCWRLLNDPTAVQEANQLFESRLNFHPRTNSAQTTYNKAWGITHLRHPKVGEEPLTSRTRRSCKSAVDPRIVTRRVTSSTSGRRRVMSSEPKNKRSVGGSSKVKVPKFRTNQTNWLRTSSLKITETGAKDLINTTAVNKIGLGETRQYNYQEFLRQETPEVYRSHGHVLLLGQRFRGDTTNSDVTAPGGFYRMSDEDLKINEECKVLNDRSTETTIDHKKSYNQQLRHTRPQQSRQSRMSVESEITEDDIPLNIRHKFKYDVTTLLKENKPEIRSILKQESDLRHTGMVPARMTVKELNHPIDPPPSYFDNFGENLKYDKFEGGLHLYIK